MSRFPKPPSSYPDLPDVKVRVYLKDDVQMVLPLRPFRLSKTAVDMVELCDPGYNDADWMPQTDADGVMTSVALHFSQVEAATFRSVWEFCQRWCENVPTPPPYDQLIYTHDLHDWNREFMEKLSNQALIDLYVASDYLDIWFLLRTCCQGLALRPDVLRSFSEAVVQK